MAGSREHVGQILPGITSLESVSITLPSMVKVARPGTTAVVPVVFGLGVKLNSHEPASDGSVLWPTDDLTKTTIRINTLPEKKLLGDIRTSIARIQSRPQSSQSSWPI
jgi:hypothetical protein